ncbi:hypothetical protein V6N11_076845 [Hibiscus sabdariffa]|uniref:Uncharacterized protein n=1 Tax=Hibiscus sabdariffa TaxID=183260 RepID=A0ABR2TBG1_9ROSI
MTWYLLLLLTGRCFASSSSRLKGISLPKLLPAFALPFLLVGDSGVGRSATAEVVGVGAAERIGTVGAGVWCVGPSGYRWSRGDFQSKTSFSSSDEKWNSSVVPALAEVWADGVATDFSVVRYGVEVLPLQTGQGLVVVVNCV